jgi:hypothetical protein
LELINIIEPGINQYSHILNLEGVDWEAIYNYYWYVVPDDNLTYECDLSAVTVYWAGFADCFDIGQPCDDGDPNTVNDLIDCFCTCTGAELEWDCPELFLNFGDICDDRDPLTLNDTVNSSCICIGFYPEGPICGGAFTMGEGFFLDADINGGGGASNLCFNSEAINAFWVHYTPSQSAPVTVTSQFDPDLPDTRLSVYTGPNCLELECLVSDDDDGIEFTSIVIFDAIFGETYYIEWDDRWDDGPFDFEISIECQTCLCEFGVDIGDPCDDGDSNNENDVIQPDCICSGTPIFLRNIGS